MVINDKACVPMNCSNKTDIPAHDDSKGKMYLDAILKTESSSISVLYLSASFFSKFDLHPNLEE